MPILSDLMEVKRGDKILVRCDNPTQNPKCWGDFTIKFNGSKTLKRLHIRCKSCARIGKRHSEETKRKIGAKHKGKIISEAQRQSISERQRGRKLPEPHRRALINANKWGAKHVEALPPLPPNILTDITKVKIGENIQVQCQNPAHNPNCKGTYEVKFRGRKTLTKSMLRCLCNSCTMKGVPKKIDHSRKTHPAILTPPAKRKTGEPIQFRCEDCSKISIITYSGKKMEVRSPFLCRKCASKIAGFKHRIPLSEKTNPAILTPPEKRIAGKHVKCKCEECGNIHKIIYTGRELEKRIPWRCRKCALEKVINFTSKPQRILYEALVLQYQEVTLNDPYLIEGCYVDVTIPKLNIAIEYDGWYWHQDKSKDIDRAGQLCAMGWRVLNIRAYKDIYDPDEFKRIVAKFIRSKKQHQWVIVGKDESVEEENVEQKEFFA